MSSHPYPLFRMIALFTTGVDGVENISTKPNCTPATNVKDFHSFTAYLQIDKIEQQ